MVMSDDERWTNNRPFHQTEGNWGEGKGCPFVHLRGRDGGMEGGGACRHQVCCWIFFVGIQPLPEVEKGRTGRVCGRAALSTVSCLRNDLTKLTHLPTHKRPPIIDGRVHPGRSVFNEQVFQCHRTGSLSPDWEWEYVLCATPPYFFLVFSTPGSQWVTFLSSRWCSSHRPRTS